MARGYRRANPGASSAKRRRPTPTKTTPAKAPVEEIAAQPADDDAAASLADLEAALGDLPDTGDETDEAGAARAVHGDAVAMSMSVLTLTAGAVGGELGDVAGGEQAGGFVLSDSGESNAAPRRLTQAGATEDAVKDYLNQIGKVPLLTAEQEIQLAKRIGAGLVAEHEINSGQRMIARLGWEPENLENLENLENIAAEAVPVKLFEAG